jgi:hypothetical protein
MSNTNNKFSNFLERQKFRYRLFILNEKTLEDVFHIELSRFTAFSAFFGAVIVLFILISLLILYSPVRHFLPGMSSVTIRSELTEEAVKIDSLSKHIYLLDLQLKSMKNIIDGSISPDTIPARPKDIDVIQWKELAETRSEREQEFRKNYEESIISQAAQNTPQNVGIKPLFVSPISGSVVVEKPQNTGSINGVVLAGKSQQPVLATASGRVILSEHNIENTHIISIQHKDGYVSVYKNAGKPLKNIGDDVQYSEPIAILSGSKSDKNVPLLIFELWQNGKAINPKTLINF